MLGPRPKKGLFFLTFQIACVIQLIPCFSWAFDPVLPTPTIPDLSSYVAQSTTNAFIQTIGFGMDHRPYEPATSLGSSFDFGIETTLVRPPSSLASAIGAIGNSASGGGTTASAVNSTTTIPFVPSLKIHLRKGLGENLDGGASTFYIPTSIPYAGGTLILGGDLKYVFYKAEEGITAAVRASYNYTDLAFSYSGYALSIKTVTISPQILVSRKLAFADPYMGMGYEYTYGTLLATVPSPPITLLPGVAIAPISLSLDGRGTGVFFFGGLSMLSLIRLRLTLEAAFNPAGENYIGTKIGFTL